MSMEVTIANVRKEKSGNLACPVFADVEVYGHPPLSVVVETRGGLCNGRSCFVRKDTGTPYKIMSTVVNDLVFDALEKALARTNEVSRLRNTSPVMGMSAYTRLRWERAAQAWMDGGSETPMLEIMHG